MAFDDFTGQILAKRLARTGFTQPIALWISALDHLCLTFTGKQPFDAGMTCEVQVDLQISWSNTPYPLQLCQGRVSHFW